MMHILIFVYVDFQEYDQRFTNMHVSKVANCFVKVYLVQSSFFIDRYLKNINFEAIYLLSDEIIICHARHLGNRFLLKKKCSFVSLVPCLAIFPLCFLN